MNGRRPCGSRIEGVLFGLTRGLPQRSRSLAPGEMCFLPLRHPQIHEEPMPILEKLILNNRYIIENIFNKYVTDMRHKHTIWTP